MYQLSVLLPSKYADKRERFFANAFSTASNPNRIEWVVCLDADHEHPVGATYRNKNIITTYAEPSPYRSHFFDAAWKASTGKFLMMGNDDIIFKTKGWDKLIPYESYPDELVLFYFRDNEFNETFACHPIWSRKIMEMESGLFEPDFLITKCDNVVWDIHPSVRRHYLPNVEIAHLQDRNMPQYVQSAYDYDNGEYFNHANVSKRKKVLERVMREIGMTEHKVMIGVCTAERARDAIFYDYLNMLEKPANSICLTIHGQSIAHSRNLIAEQALIHNCTHVFFLDDDVLPRPSALLQLLSNHEPIVCALQLKRNYPHQPIAFDLKRGQTLELGNLTGLQPIVSGGLGACLISTDVFNKMEPPFFRLGELEPDQMNEDAGFFKRAKALAFQPMLDLNTRVGHIGSVAIWPEMVDGNWYTTYDTQGTGRAMIPQLKSEMAGV